MRYTATWPIYDDSLRLSELTAEATDDLADMLEQAGLVMISDIHWHIRAGARPTLKAEVEVRTFRHDRHASILEGRGRGLTASQVADELGVKTDTLARWCERHGHADLAAWFRVERDRSRDYAARYAATKKPCPDCGTLIGAKSQHCRPCANAYKPTIKQAWTRKAVA